jgi:soluble lytic murein transglycosylase-like protein
MWRFASVFLILSSLATAANAFCYEQAGAEYGLSPEILRSISTTESENNPYAVHLNTDGTYDVGLMQINSSWKKSVGQGLWSRLFDPCTNVRMGAWILAGCVKRYGYGWKAVGCYHSSTPSKRYGYAKKVARALVLNRLRRQVTRENGEETQLFSKEDQKAEDTTPWDAVFGAHGHVR